MEISLYYIGHSRENGNLGSSILADGYPPLLEAPGANSTIGGMTNRVKRVSS